MSTFCFFNPAGVQSITSEVEDKNNPRVIQLVETTNSIKVTTSLVLMMGVPKANAWGLGE